MIIYFDQANAKFYVPGDGGATYGDVLITSSFDKAFEACEDMFPGDGIEVTRLTNYDKETLTHEANIVRG